MRWWKIPKLLSRSPCMITENPSHHRRKATEHRRDWRMRQRSKHQERHEKHDLVSSILRPPLGQPPCSPRLFRATEVGMTASSSKTKANLGGDGRRLGGLPHWCKRPISMLPSLVEPASCLISFSETLTGVRKNRVFYRLQKRVAWVLEKRSCSP